MKRWATYNGCSDNGVKLEQHDLEANIAGAESTALAFKENCKNGGSSELWTIPGGSHIPALSESFSRQLVEWLFAHPKSAVR